MFWHKLLLIYFLLASRNVIPLLKEFAEEKGSSLIFNKFEVPKYVCGKSKKINNSTSNGKTVHDDESGIIILEDLSSQGYNLVDPDLMMFNLEEIKVIWIYCETGRTKKVFVSFSVLS